MKRLLWLLAPLALGGAVAKSDGFRLRDDVRGELRIGGRGLPPRSSGAAPYTFCDTALAAGNRTGTWGCINGDGTAPTGDNLGPWVVSGSPSSTSGTTCASPSYKTLTTASPAQRYESTVAVTSVPSAFSWCAVYQATATLTAAFFWGNYPCCSGYAVTVEESVTLRQYTTGGASVNSAVTVGTDKTLVCGSYSGGTSVFYVRNATLGTSYQSGAGAPAAAGYKITFGADSDSSSARVDGKFFGGFYTEKAMAQSDFDTIYAAVAGAGCT